MKTLQPKYLIIAILTFIVSIAATAQDVYKLNEENSNLSVTGTSSLHDWEMEATGFSAETRLRLEDDSISEIEYVKFSTPVTKLESGKNTMDTKAQDALRAKKFPQIKFTLEGDKSLAFSGKSTIDGQLTVAGKTREIEVPVRIDILSDRKFTASGKLALKMSDFGIEPPTAFFGTIKTDNEVKVKFDFEFTKSI
ncbi:MAG: YceI family protein [Bacteroidota bacterium]